MRLFVAVYPDERFAAALSAVIDPWRERIPARWTPARQWHVTLQFLGEWPESRLAGLQAALGEAADGEEIAVRPGSLGGFPDLCRPRVLFVHLDGGESLVRLAANVRAKVARVWPDGPQDRRPLRPHLTVARLRSEPADGDLNPLREIRLTGLPAFTVAGIELVASDLARRGATHRGLGYWRLRKKGE